MSELLPNRPPVVEYWKTDFHTTEPHTPVVPYLWKFDELKDLLIDARDSISAMDAERRLLCLSNPGLPNQPFAATTTLLADLQLLRPGERAPAHRHSTSSVRLCLEGHGAYTMVEQEKCPMERGDVILNPVWAWHHHGNEGTEDVIWMDVLDVPMVTSLGSIVYDYDYAKEGDAEQHFITPRSGASRSDDLFGSGGVVPKLARSAHGTQQPQVTYRYARMREALERMKSYEMDPYDGFIAEYVNPMTGRPIIPTMSVSMQLLPPGVALGTHRHTSSTVYCVVEGSGHSIIGDKTYEWTKNDIFVVPSWCWHRHVNTGDQDAVLFAVTDAQPIQLLGFYREEAEENGTIVPVKRDYATLAWRTHEYEALKN
jgi:gentisate 1,2-dioxygenase